MSVRWLLGAGSIVLSLMFWSCDDEEETTDDGGVSAVDTGAGGQGGQGGQAPMDGPSACEEQADCEGACPPETLGCSCTEMPMGSQCLPTCEEDEDCPSPPDGTVLSCQEGTCKPANMPPEGMGGMGGMPPDGMGGMPPDGMGGMPPDGMGGMPPDGMGGMPPDGMGGMPPDGMGGMGGMMGPTACEEEAECEGACPAGAAGCTCAETPMGGLCAPTCAEAADCVMGMDGVAHECVDGICRPEGEMMPPDGMGGMGGAPPDGMGGMMGPSPCENEGDCEGACPPESAGCTCGETPMGSLCVPTCAEDADCPEGPEGGLVCRDNVCRPAGMMMPGG